MSPKWLRISSLVACLVALLVWAVPVRGQGNGALVGKVENGTAGSAGSLDRLPVTLHTSDGEVELASLETTTDAQGAFRFGGLDADPTLIYWTEVVYQGVSYSGTESLSFQDGDPELQSTLTVFDTTDDGSAVRVESVHLVAESFEQVLRISEVHVLGNTSDRTYVGKADAVAGGRTVSLFVPLPKNAVGVGFPEDEPAGRYVEVEGGLWDTQPVLPGAEGSVVRFSYHLVVEGTSIPLEREFRYPVSSLSVLVVQPGLTLRSDQLLSGEPITFQDTQYEVYQAEGLGAGEPLKIELVPSSGQESTGMPVAPAGTEPATREAEAGQQGLLRWLGLALVVLSAAGAVAYPFVTRPRSRA